MFDAGPVVGLAVTNSGHQCGERFEPAGPLVNPGGRRRPRSEKAPLPRELRTVGRLWLSQARCRKTGGRWPRRSVPAVKIVGRHLTFPIERLVAVSSFSLWAGRGG